MPHYLLLVKAKEKRILYMKVEVGETFSLGEDKYKYERIWQHDKNTISFISGDNKTTIACDYIHIEGLNEYAKQLQETYDWEKKESEKDA